MRRLSFGVAAAAVVLLCAGLVAPASAAFGLEDPLDPPVPTPGALIVTPADGSFLGSPSVTVTGFGSAAGNTVEINRSGQAICTATVAASVDDPTVFTWSCALTGLADGPGLVLKAIERAGDVTVREASITLNVLGPPSIAGRGPILTTGIIEGNGYPGSTIVLSLGASAVTCPTPVLPSGYWSCSATTAAGVYTVAARQSNTAVAPAPAQSDPSFARTVTIDNLPPEPPNIVSPRGDYRIVTLPATVSGTGEPGALVHVYIDGVPACSTISTTDAWSCVVDGPHRGAHQVKANQTDAAGNLGGFSPPLRVFFGAPAAPPSETPVASPESPTGEPTPSPTAPEPSVPSPPSTFPWNNGGGPTVHEALTNWGSPTKFGSALPGLAESVERGNWGRAILLSLGAILLIALPLRLLSTSLRGRLPWSFGSLTGRNRGADGVPRAPARPEAGANPWLAGFVPLAATTAFIVISSGVNSEVRYLRLALAVGAALAVLNIVGVALAAKAGNRWQKVEGWLRFLPILLLAAAVTGLLSRGTGLEPPIVTGVLIGIKFAVDTPVRRRALVNLVQVGTVLGLGVGGWIGHSLLGPQLGFLPSLLSESLAALCLAGIGSALVLMLPLGALPGRVIFEWSIRVWLIVALLGATVCFAIILGGASSHFPVAPTLLIAAGFAAFCVIVWAWRRFVRPPARA